MSVSPVKQIGSLIRRRLSTALGIVLPTVATGSLPTGEEGLLVSDSTTHRLLHHNGTAYKSLLFDGGSLSGCSDFITATHGSSVLTANYNIAATAGTYVGTGLTVTLPAAGTYLLGANVRCTLNGAVGASILHKLCNSTDTTDIDGTLGVTATSQVTGVNALASVGLSIPYTVGASKTIELYVARIGSSFTTTSIIGSASSPRQTALWYVRIA